VAEKKFSVRPVPSATVGKAFADGLLAFAESFWLSAKPGFLVVRPCPTLAYDYYMFPLQSFISITE
jgi:hypothetical protein